jgi:hypothetical protein
MYRQIFALDLHRLLFALLAVVVRHISLPCDLLAYEMLAGHYT